MPGPHVIKRFRVLALVATITAFVGWTLVVFATNWLAPMDRIGRHPWLNPDSYVAQIAGAIAVVTFPLVFAVVLAVMAFWSWRRRLRNLAWGILITGLLAWPGEIALKAAFGRARPPSPSDYLISYHGSSYPSAHMAMVTATAAVIIVATTTTRQPRSVLLTWRIVSVLAIVLVALDRLILNAHWPSDIVGGILFGLLCSAAGLVGARVRTVPATRRPPRRTQSAKRTCAVIYNPARLVDVPALRRHVEYELEQRGWDDALWLPTHRDDPGRAMTAHAISANVDLVLVAGGDGTVREVCSGLAGSGIPLGVIPSGTGNLLARNLGIPFDQMDALRVAFEGVSRHIDLIRVVPDDNEELAEHFAIMAGVGADARLMEATSPELKKAVGSAAYFLAVSSTVRPHLFDITYQVDDEAPAARTVSLALMGNMGMLQAGITMFPDASPTDGLVDLIVAAPAGVRDWATLATKILVRDRSADPRMDEAQGQRITIRCAEPMVYELDGDMRPAMTKLVAEAVPGALTVKLPAQRAQGIPLVNADALEAARIVDSEPAGDDSPADGAGAGDDSPADGAGAGDAVQTDDDPAERFADGQVATRRLP